MWLGSGCGGDKAQAPLPPADYAMARGMSDMVANDLIQDDVKDLYDKLDVGFHMVVANSKELDEQVHKMYEMYGHPTECVFKIARTGVRVDGPWKRSSRSFIYAVRTTKYAKGKYFLQVEIVPAYSGGFIDVSGFGFFNFKDGVVPDYLK